MAKLAELESPSVTDWLAQHGITATPDLMRRLGAPLTKELAKRVRSLAELPQRAQESATSLFYGGSYDPEPVLDVAGMVVGAPGTPRGALGVGATSPLPKGMPKWAQEAIENTAKAEVDEVAAALSSIEKKLKVEAPTEKRSAGGLSQRRIEAAERMRGYLEPLNWMGLESKHRREIPPIPARAWGMGFNPDYPLFKGGSERAATREYLQIPEHKKYERGLFFGDDPNIAEAYGIVSPYVARAKNPAQVDWRLATGSKYYDESGMDPIIEAARRAGHDVLLVKGLKDLGSLGLQNQVVVLDPKVLRRPEAKFDPAKIDINNLLAGLAGGAVVAPGLAGLPLTDDRRQ